jgi:hypothetical protein
MTGCGIMIQNVIAMLKSALFRVRDNIQQLIKPIFKEIMRVIPFIGRFVIPLSALLTIPFSMFASLLLLNGSLLILDFIMPHNASLFTIWINIFSLEGIDILRALAGLFFSIAVVCFCPFALIGCASALGTGYSSVLTKNRNIFFTGAIGGISGFLSSLLFLSLFHPSSPPPLFRHQYSIAFASMLKEGEVLALLIACAGIVVSSLLGTSASALIRKKKYCITCNLWQKKKGTVDKISIEKLFSLDSSLCDNEEIQTLIRDGRKDKSSFRIVYYECPSCSCGQMDITGGYGDDHDTFHTYDRGAPLSIDLNDKVIKKLKEIP